MGILPRAARIASGSIRLDGRDLLGLSERQWRRVRGKEIAMIFQDPMTSLNPVLTVGAQLREAIEEHLDLDRKAATRRAIELLDQVGIPSPADRLRNYPHQFSGGMRQRVMIAIALACEPKVLIADEPTTALDVTIQAQILDLLRDLVADRGTALVLITHDLGVVAGMCERVQVMYAGTLVEEGTASDVFAAPRHPYTLGLLQSVPRLDTGRKQPLRPIPGAPRNMLSEPASCPFAPRCRNRIDRCDAELPQLERLDTGQRAACFNPAAADEWQRSRLGGEAA
jgi:oligopeptide/dipeptide ABC transporter ATP-binding protein